MSMKGLYFLLGFALLRVLPGHSASLSLPDQTAVAGQVLVTPLSFSSQGQAVSGIQFDLDSDAPLSFTILPDSQIGSSAKVLYSSALTSGIFRVLIVGMNQTTLGDGGLLRLLIAVDPNASAATAKLRIRNAIATDPNGGAGVISPATATIQIQPAAAGQSFPTVSLMNAASLQPGPISPGEIVAIFGGADLSATSAVQIGSASAPILYAGAGQVNAIVPFGLDATTAASLKLVSGHWSTGAIALPTAAVSPALFTQAANGTGPGAILNEDYSLNSFSNPATAGSTVMLYGTGFGTLVPPATDGQIASDPAQTATAVTASIAGMPAQVTYAGAAPGLIAGVVQINIRIPQDAPSSPAAPVSLSVGTAVSPAGATIAIR